MDFLEKTFWDDFGFRIFSLEFPARGIFLIKFFVRISAPGIFLREYSFPGTW